MSFGAKLYSAVDMGMLDVNSEYLGVSRHKLMENAGSAVANYILTHYPKAKTILIIAGLGNNGGDGFVAARHLSHKYKIIVDLIGKGENIRTVEARDNYNILKRMKSSVRIYDSASTKQILNHIAEADIIVDAILGTGVKGELRDPIKTIVRYINSCGKIVISVDTPTGLDPTDGRICGEAVKATTTITFHGNKKGFINKREYTGNIVISNIGIPLEAEIQTGPGDLEAIKWLNVVNKQPNIGLVGVRKFNVNAEFQNILVQKDIKPTVLPLDKIYDIAGIYIKDVKKLKITDNIITKFPKHAKIIFCDGRSKYEKIVNRYGPGCYVLRLTKHEFDIQNYLSLKEYVSTLKSCFPNSTLIIIHRDIVCISYENWIKLGRIKQGETDDWLISALILNIAHKDSLYNFTATLWIYGGPLW